MNIGIIVGLSFLGLIVLFFAAVGIGYLTHSTPVTNVSGVGRDPMPEVRHPEFRETLHLLTHTSLAPGHDLVLLTNGDETYPRLWDDLRAAKTSITLQMYYCNVGQMANQLRDVLVERARAGVKIMFLHDAIGSSGLTKEYTESLRTGGVEVATFRPRRWHMLHKVQQRSHIRVVVVDGCVAYTGGFGIDDKWFGDGKHKDQWRDTNVRFTGPAVLQLQAAFVAGWAEATGTLLTGALFFPLLQDWDEDLPIAGLVHSTPTIGCTSAERLYAITISSARQSLFISNSYLVPDTGFQKMICEAAKRGVDVRLLVPGDQMDVKLTLYASRYRYERLLEAGVRIFEYQPSMMHAKSFVVDGFFSAAGTMNFDNRSLAYNDETNMLILDEGFGTLMMQQFETDTTFSKEIDLATFRQRSWKDRAHEKLANSVWREL